jgi:hypothetical protein
MNTGQLLASYVAVFGAGSVVGAGLAALGIDVYHERQRKDSGLVPAQCAIDGWVNTLREAGVDVEFDSPGGAGPFKAPTRTRAHLTLVPNQNGPQS